MKTYNRKHSRHITTIPARCIFSVPSRGIPRFFEGWDQQGNHIFTYEKSEAMWFSSSDDCVDILEGRYEYKMCLPQYNI